MNFQSKRDINLRARLLKEQSRLELDKKKLQEAKNSFLSLCATKESELERIKNELEANQIDVDTLKIRYNTQLSLVSDFIHEQKRINERINKAIFTTSEIVRRQCSVDHIDRETVTLIINNWKTIKALSEISSLRMELFEFSIAPEIFRNVGMDTISIYRSFEKIYKSINSGYDKEARDFRLNGNSYGYYKSQRVLQIAIFILLDNAWKYTIPEEKIDINFIENDDTLTVDIINWGPWIEDEEIEMITKRGFRGHNAIQLHKNFGKGLGLAIAKDILDICNVEYDFCRKPCPQKYRDGIRYGLFCATLKFKPIEFKD